MARHRNKTTSARRRAKASVPYAWLGAGIVGAGMGAAIVCGAGAAYADEGSASDGSSASTSAATTDSKTAKNKGAAGPSRGGGAEASEPTSSRQDTPTSHTGNYSTDTDEVESNGNEDADAQTDLKSDSGDLDTDVLLDGPNDADPTPAVDHLEPISTVAKSTTLTSETLLAPTSIGVGLSGGAARLVNTSYATIPDETNFSAYAVPAVTTSSAIEATATINQPIEVQQEFNTLGELQSYTADYARQWILNVPAWSTLNTDSPDYVPGDVFPYTVVRPEGGTLSGTGIPVNLQGAAIPDNVYVVSFKSFNGTVNPAPTTLVLSIQRLNSSHPADVVEDFVYDPVQTWYYSQIWAFKFDPFAGHLSPPTAPVIKNVTVTEEVYDWIDLVVSGGTDDKGIVAYQILKDGKLLATVQPGTEYTEYNLQSGVTYVYTARSVDTDGQVSTDSAPLTVTTKDVVKPTAPIITSLSVTSDSVTLTAYDGTDNVGVVGYNIYRDGVRIGTISVNSGAPFIDTLVESDVRYSYTARAVDAAHNESTDSRAVFVTTLTPEEEEVGQRPWETYWERINAVASLIPGVNVVFAVASFIVDALQLTDALARCWVSDNCAGIGDEIVDLTSDVIGVIPFTKSLGVGDYAGQVFNAGISFVLSALLGWTYEMDNPQAEKRASKALIST